MSGELLPRSLPPTRRKLKGVGLISDMMSSIVSCGSTTGKSLSDFEMASVFQAAVAEKDACPVLGADAALVLDGVPAARVVLAPTRARARSVPGSPKSTGWRAADASPCSESTTGLAPVWCCETRRRRPWPARSWSTPKPITISVSSNRICRFVLRTAVSLEGRVPSRRILRNFRKSRIHAPKPAAARPRGDRETCWC